MRGEPTLKLLLIRHGETDYNRDGRFYGRIDVPLNRTGVNQARAAAERLRARPVRHVYSSPAQRAVQTAEAINQNWHAVLTTDERLWEIDHGRWEGLSIGEVAALDPQTWQAWLAGELDAPHGGETMQQVTDRVQAWLNDVQAQHVGEMVAAVAHGGSLQIALCLLLRTEINNLWPYRFGNTGTAEVWVYREGATLLSLG